MTPSKAVVICVPTFNSESTLTETLTSLTNQTYQSITIKVFDNASTDRTLQIARELSVHDGRIQVFAHSENVGAEGNFNRCLAAADGDYTALFHADDIYESDMVERQVRFLETHPQCTAVATQATIIDAHGVPHGLRFLPKEAAAGESTVLSFEKLFQLTLEYGNFITCPSVMAKSSVYRDVIETWDGKTYGSSADLDVWLRLAKAGAFGVLTKPLMRYRVSEASFTVRETRRRFTEHDLLKVYRSYLSTAEAQGDREKLRYFYFHEFKDAAARRLNILQSGRRDLAFPDFNGNKFAFLPVLLKSRYHFKFLTASYMIFAVTSLMKALRLHK